MEIVHRSKIDTWLLITLLFGASVSMAAAGFIVYVDASPLILAIALFTLVVGTGLPIWLLTSTFYRIQPGWLVVRSGPIRFNIPLDEITAITPSGSWLSSPALSLDRLRIDYGKGKALMISPSNKEQFLKDIKRVQNDMA